MLKALIFDFDGVIVDSEWLHLRAFNEVAAQFNIEISEQDYYGKYLGLNDREVFEILVADNRLTGYTDKIAGLVEQKTTVFKQLAATKAAVIEGVTEFLNMLKQNNIPAAICSGALESEIKLLLTGTELAGYFHVIVAAEHVTKGKPDPEGFLLTLCRLNEKLNTDIKPAECIVIEDSHWGLQAAGAAGMHPVAVTNTYPSDRLTLAEKIVAKLAELEISDLHSLCP